MRYSGKCKNCSAKFIFDAFGDVNEAIDRILNYYIKECPRCKNNNNES